MRGNVDNPCSHSVGFAEMIWRRLFPVINTVSILGKAGGGESSHIQITWGGYTTEFGRGTDNVSKIGGELNRSSETPEWETFRCWKPKSFGTVIRDTYLFQDKTTKDTKRINCPKTSQHENVFLKTSLNGCLIKTFTDWQLSWNCFPGFY